MESLYERISKGTMAVSEITESMKYATSEGGKYFNSMDKQSKTLAGQLSTLKDNATQLLGAVMLPMTNALRDKLVPMANEILGEFGAAFESGGFDGLMNAVIEKIPVLLNAVMNGAKRLMSGLSKWLPGAIKQVVGLIPGALHTILAILPQIVTLLFDLVSTAVSGLIEKLPELVPMLVEGVVKLVGSVIKGVAKVMMSATKSLISLFKMTGDELQEALSGKDLKIDNELYLKLKAQADLGLTVNTNPEAYKQTVQESVDVITGVLGGITGMTEQDRLAFMMDIIDGFGGSDMIEKALKFAFPEVDTSMITDAMDTVSSVVSELGLSEDASRHIADIIAGGGGVSDIAAAIASYGVEPGVANEAATKIANCMNAIAQSGRAVGLTSQQITELQGAALVGRDAVIAALKLYGVKDEDIQEVLDSYDTVSGSLVAHATIAFDQVATLLTNGKSGDDTEAKQLIIDYFKDAYGKVDEWKAQALQELEDSGLTGAELTTATGEIVTQYDAMVASLNALEQESLAWHKANAGEATAFVQGNLTALEEILGRVQDINTQIDMLTGAAFDATRSKRTLLQNGVAIDSADQQQVIEYTATERDLSIEAADEKYAAMLDEAAVKYANNSQKFTEERERIKALQAAELLRIDQEYNDQMAKNLQGMAMSDPVAAAAMEDYFRIQDIGKQAEELKGAIASEIMKANMTGEPINPEEFFANLTAQGVDFAAIAKQMGLDPDEFMMSIYSELMGGGENPEASGKISEWLTNYLGPEMTTALQTAEASLTDENTTLTVAIEEGWLLPGVDGVDWTSANTQMATYMSAFAEGGVSAFTDAAASMTDAATNAANSAATAMDQSGVAETSGENTGQSFIDGVKGKNTGSYGAGYALGFNMMRGLRSVLGIASPSKVMRALGINAGGSFTGSFLSSIDSAVAQLPRHMNNLITAANLPFRAMPYDASQAITAALAGAGGLIDYDRLALSNANVGIYMDGQLVGRLVERGVSARQMERSTAYTRAHKNG